ncbi:MAG: site-2 protease family protein [Gammaproteobacteria bacterium]|nr:site-2 protease family protein [Gammaproteobacteria bacterium]
MDILLLIPVLLLSIIVHEVAHAWVALREGDDTAYTLGRITLNPLPHIDLIGSILVPLGLYFMNAGFLFGWAKPVPVNPRKYHNYRRGDIRVSLAGIAANLILAAGFTLLAALLMKTAQVSGGALSGPMDVAVRIAELGILINLVLAFFNLVPIPPLDGSHVLYHLLPTRLGVAYRRLGRYGMLILLAVFFLFPGPFFSIVLAPVRFFMGAAQDFIDLWL